jgi:hypothetical protein
MKNKKNTLLIGFAAALAMFFASCERKEELPDNQPLDGYATVRIRSMSVSEGGSESPTRSALQKEPEMISTPVGDGMLMEMNIQEDETPLRDKVELTIGAYFRIIAVKAGTTEYHSHGDYIYGDPSTLLRDFHVKIGEEYDYICFSYNKITNTLPDQTYSDGVALPSPSLSINPANDDPLWCKITGLGQVTSAGVDLDITMKRRLAKVKVKVDCGYNGWKITGVTDNQVAVVVNDPDYNCTLNWGTGILSGTSLDQGLSYSISDNTLTYQTSDEVTVIPNGSNGVIKFKADAVSRNGLGAVPSAEKSATLAQALSGGVSYTITVRLRTPIFARSNIYWDNTAQKLTFQPAADDPADNVDTYQGYQGVFFKWGSLVGISPAQTEDPESEGTMTGSFLPSTPIYVPVFNVTTPTSSTWKPTTGDAMAADNTFSDVESDWDAWGDNTNTAADIPYMDPKRGTGTPGRGNTWLIDAERNVPDTLNGFRGDICQYLTTKTHAVSGDYRLPTSYEFGPHTVSAWATGSANADGWIKSDGFFSFNPAIGKPDGTADLLDDAAGKNGGERVYGSAISSPLGVVFPTSGYRQANGGALTSMGIGGYYWSCSAYDTTRSIILRIYTDAVSSENAANRSYAFSVRCVKKVNPTGSY